MKFIRAMRRVQGYVGRNKYLILTSLMVLVIAMAYTAFQYIAGGSLALANQTTLAPLFTALRIGVYLTVVASLSKRLDPAKRAWWESYVAVKVIMALVVFEFLVVQEGLIFVVKGVAKLW